MTASPNTAPASAGHDALVDAAADVDEGEIQRLIAAGEHAAAAAALRHRHQPARAATLYESLFEYSAALSCFEAASDVVGAVRVAIAMGDMSALARLVGEAIRTGRGDALITALSKAGRHVEVGRVYAARGEHVAAAQAFEAGGALSDAARCYEDLGEIREAGLFLERWLEQHPDDEGAALRLGRILARFGRHDDAIALMQRAVKNASAPDRTMCKAAPTMALAFVALGYDQAAAAVVSSWRSAHARIVANDPETIFETPPTSLQALLSSARAAAFSAVQETNSTVGSRPPTDATGMDALFDVDVSAEVSANDAGDNDDANNTDSGAVGVAGVDNADGDADAQRRLLLNGRYLLGEPLGGGGVGQVFRAYDAFSDRAVAVKIFGAQALSSEAVAGWAREVRAAANLEHPGIVKLVELNMGQGFVVTELHGEDDGATLLEDKLQMGGDGGWLLPALMGILDVLAAAHRTGLVHGGLKPRNVFVVPGGVKLLDTGAHRLLSLRATETGGLASVWPYLSPELLFGAPADVDGDLYAVAALAYRALSGRPPFSTATADRRLPPPPLSDVGVTGPVADAWDAFFAVALSPIRAARFADASAMMQALPTKAPPTLPRAVSVDSAKDGVVEASGGDRYIKGALVDRQPTLRTYEAHDAVVNRSVWLVERVVTPQSAETAAGAEDPLAAFLAAARLWRGVQPVYDIVTDDAGHVVSVVLARDQRRRVVDLAQLREVPQGLSRDLAAVASALDSLHKAGVALGGFPVVRALGPIGPRLRFAPAPLLVAATDDAIAKDWASFGAVVAAAFDAVSDDTLDDRGRLLAALHNGRFLERHDLEDLARDKDAPWPRFLLAVEEHLVRGAQGRVMAKLVASVVRPT
jgi:tetratricopeptide (TPR) repeat protein